MTIKIAIQPLKRMLFTKLINLSRKNTEALKDNLNGMVNTL